MLILSWLAGAGCFRPRLQSGSFACEPTDDPPCPSGFYCYQNRCRELALADVDAADGRHDLSAGDDLATVGGEDLAGRDLAGRDLASAPADLAAPADLMTPADLAKPRDLSPPPDLATGECGHAGAPCTSIADCCSQYCRTDGICIGG